MTHILPPELYNAAAVRAMDACAIQEHNLPGAVLMKRAGRVCFDTLQAEFDHFSHVSVFCGGGNNGGDGYVVAGLAKAAGYSVEAVYLTAPEQLTGDAQRAYQYALQEGVNCIAYGESYSMPQQGVIVDALLGTGLSGSVRDNFANAISAINTSGLPVLAVDVPSGLAADTGAELGPVVMAQATCTFIGLKAGLMTGQGPSHAGLLIFADLGVPEAVLDSQTPTALRLDLAQLLSRVPQRKRAAHKGDFGHCLIIGGDTGYGGAALMSAEACARMGAGLTSLATRPENITAANVRIPEVMAAPIRTGVELADLLAKANVIAVGPGLGQKAWGEQQLLAAITAGKTLVVDADGLNLLAAGVGAEALTQRNQQLPLVLTPHPGEAARLLAVSTQAVQADRFTAVKALAKRFSATVLLKGAGTLIADADGPIYLCDSGNPGMASGGMGDVLTGVISGLLAQGLPPMHAVQLGVCLHATAADRQVSEHGQRGLLATDLITTIRSLLNGF